MAQNAARKYDAGAAAFFVDTLCQDADSLLRFGFALTLSEELAAGLVQRTYKTILPKLPEFLKKDASFIKLQLLRRLWELHHEEVQEGQSPNIKLYGLWKQMELETRAVLFLMDVAGLTFEETLQITPMDEIDLRKHLAVGRMRLLDFRFE
jgi:hypothetical protein